MGKLTTHVLDTASGVPAAGMTIDLWRAEADARQLLKTVITNSDGRVDAPLLENETLVAGCYELHFHAGEYFQARQVVLATPPFLDVIPVCFGIAERNTHYHVPLLLSPYGYSTYRGS